MAEVCPSLFVESNLLKIHIYIFMDYIAGLRNLKNKKQKKKKKGRKRDEIGNEFGFVLSMYFM